MENPRARLVREQVAAVCDYVGTALVLSEEYAAHTGTPEKIAQCKDAATKHAVQAVRLSLLLQHDV